MGTSGWSYGHWRGVFYPEKLASGRWLSYYARNFDTVELNASFYRLHPRSTFEGWAAQVGPGFQVAVKASRFITHVRRLREVEEPVRTFMERVEGLGDRLGPVLFQLPPDLPKDLTLLADLLEILPDRARFAFEFRNAGWFSDDVYDALARSGAALCIADSTRYPSAREITAPFSYLRFHGGGELYGSEYSRDELRKWADRIAGYTEQGVECFVFFNNDAHGYALRNARELREVIGGVDSAAS